MKKLINTLFLSTLLLLGFNACNEADSSAADDTQAISEEALFQIKELGFSTQGVIKEEDHYIVEGDIVLHQEDLQRSNFHENFLRIAETEQYRTTNLVTSLPRVITLSKDNKLPSSYATGLQGVASRYNAENLGVTFQYISSGIGDIHFVKANGSYLASAGFPTAGNPYNRVNVNSRAIGDGSTNYAITIMAHEIGHCIGFRHTDYADRSYSCGGATSNEGASSVGAILIPGTPSGPDAGSWMLACIGSGQNRPFNNNDKTALNALY